VEQVLLHKVLEEVEEEATVQLTKAVELLEQEQLILEVVEEVVVIQHLQLLEVLVVQV